MFEIKNINGLGSFLEIVHAGFVYHIFILPDYISICCCDVKYLNGSFGCWFLAGRYSIRIFLDDNIMEDHYTQSRASPPFSKEQLVIIKKYVKLTFLN